MRRFTRFRRKDASLTEKTSGSSEVAISPNTKIIHIVAIVFLAALVMRTCLFLAILILNPAGFYDVDSAQYWQISSNMLTHHAFSSSPQSPFQPESLRTPLYPFFLALLRWLHLSEPGIVLVQIIIGSVTAVLTSVTFFGITGQDKTALLAGLIVALDVPSIVFSNLLMSEGLFTLLLLCSVWSLFQVIQNKNCLRSAILAGIFSGFASLCRPIALLLPLLVAISLLLIPRRPSLRFVALSLFSSLLVIAPWFVRNRILFDSTFFSTVTGNDLLLFRAAGVYAVKHQVSFQEAQHRLGAYAEKTFAGDIIVDQPAFNSHQQRIAISILKNDPGIYVAVHVKSTVLLLVRPLRNTIDLQLGLGSRGLSIVDPSISSTVRRLFNETSRPTMTLVAIQLTQLLVVWPMFVVGFVFILRKKQWNGAMFLLPFFYLCILSGGRPGDDYARFRVPMLPLIAVSAAIGIGGLSRCPVQDA